MGTPSNFARAAGALALLFGAFEFHALAVVVPGPCPPPPAVFGLGTAGNYSVLALAGADLVISEGATNIEGDVGLGADGTGSLLKAKIDGTLYLDPTAHPDIHGDLTVTGGIVVKSMSAEQSDALSANASLAALASTQASIGPITSSTTITGGSGMNVVRVAGVNMVKGTLTISGPADALFVINVTDGGGFNFSSSKMVLAGGVEANDIVWNFIGDGADIDIFKDVTVAYGTFLAPYRNILQDHANVSGRYIGATGGRTLKLHSAATLACPE
jgi:choice-of-anchor A domain-containing protein